MRKLLIATALLLASCADNLAHESPFDPESPAGKQAPGVLTGRVTLEGESDFAGVSVQLQGAAKTYAVDTLADGSFRIAGIVPGTYRLHTATRYFFEAADDVAIPIGGALDLPVKQLAARRAGVRGSARVELLDANHAAVQSGGVMVTLTRTGSVRGGAAQAAVRFAAEATTEAESYTTQSADDGSYSFDGVPVGLYALTAQASGIVAALPETLTIDGESAHVTPADLVVKALTGFFTIKGTAAGAQSTELTQVPGVTLELTGLGAVKMAIGRTPSGLSAGCLWGATMPYAALVPYTLLAEGKNTLCVRFFGEVGDETEPILQSIVYDATPPALPRLQINAGAPYATSSLAALSLSAVDATSGVAQVKIGFAQSLSGVTAQEYVSSLVFALGADGAKTVWASFGDKAGNFGAPVSAQAVVDSLAPAVTSFEVDDAGGAPAAVLNTTAALVRLAASDASPLQLLVSTRSDFADATWQSYQPLFPFTLPYTSAPNGADDTVYAKVRDAAGHESGVFTVPVHVDLVAPSGAFITPASTQVTMPAVTLTLGATGASRVQLAPDAGFTAPRDFAFTATTTYTLAPGDGVKTVFARFFDSAGNASPVVQAAVVLDQTPPANGALVIDGGAAFIRDVLGHVQLALTAADALSGVSTMRIGNAAGGCAAALAGATAEPFVSPRTWTLDSPGAGVTGARTVCAAFRDAAGNWSSPVSATVQYDTQAPAVYAESVRIGDGGPYATSTQVQLSFDVTGATEMQIGNDGAFTGAWEPYRAATVWFLPNQQGAHTVGVKFRDAAGNTAGPVVAGVTLDSIAPAQPGVVIGAGYAYANTWNVTLTLTSVGQTRMQLSNDGVFDSEPVTTYTSPIMWSLTPGQGFRAVYARFLDDAGNAGPVASALVVVDSIPPANGSIAVNGGDAYTRNSAVTLTLSSAGADEMLAADGACPAAGAFVPMAGSLAFNLGSTQGLHTLYTRFRDAAGNLSAQCASTAITLDLAFTDSVSAQLKGVENIAGRTGDPLVTLKLAGLGADAWEMQIASDSGLTGAAWSPVTTSTTWLLATGDGLKTVYVRVRDRAGNLSSILQPQITLVQTGPDVPGLLLADIDGDGFAIGSDSVELRWSRPSTPYLAGFELQRYVVGVDATFRTLASVGQGTVTFGDTITGGTLGYVHNYRVRAFDDLGNASDWSLPVQATPFKPIDKVFRLRDMTGDRFFFPPNRGTFSLRPTYAYDTNSGIVETASLAQDVTSWNRPVPAGHVSNERLVVRTANQDNGLVYSSVLDLGFDLRQTLFGMPYSINSRDLPLFVDPSGVLHLCYHLGYTQCVSNASGAWVAESTLFDTYDFVRLVRTGPDSYAAVGSSQGGPVYYYTQVGGVWSAPELVAAGNFAGADLDVDTAGNVHVAFAEWLGGGDKLYYANNVTGSWHTEVAGDAVMLPARIKVDAAGAAHIVDYYGGPVYYTNRTGSWTSYTPGDGTGDPFPSLALDSQGHAFMSYYVGNAVKLATDASGAFVNLPVASGVSVNYTLVTVGPDDYPQVAFDDTFGTGLHVMRRDFAGWQDTVAERSGLSFNPAGLVSTPDDVTYLTYGDSNGGVNVLSIGRGPVKRTLTTGVSEPAVMRFDAQGAPRFMYLTGTYGSFALNYGTLDAAGRLAGELVDGLPAREPWAPAFDIDAAGDAHVSYFDRVSSTLRYATNACGGWTFEEVDATPDDGITSNIVADSAGYAHVAYLMGTSWQTILKYAENTSGSWVTETVPMPDGTFSYAHQPYLAYDAGGELHMLVGVDKTGLYAPRASLYGTRTNGAWQMEIIPSPGFMMLGGGVLAMTYDAAGAVHALIGNGYSATIYLTNAGGAWSAESLEQVSGYSAGIAVDAGGKVHVVYDDGNAGRLRYATNAFGGWTFATLDGTDLPSGPAFAADAYGVFHLLYPRRNSAELIYQKGFAGWLPASSVSRAQPFQ